MNKQKRVHHVELPFRGFHPQKGSDFGILNRSGIWGSRNTSVLSWESEKDTKNYETIQTIWEILREIIRAFISLSGYFLRILKILHLGIFGEWISLVFKDFQSNPSGNSLRNKYLRKKEMFLVFYLYHLT